jgi:preprotein translocase subunit SecA
MDLPVQEWAKEEGIAESEILERVMKASDDKMAEKRARAGDTFFNYIEKSFVLRILDQHWKEHLLHLDHLRQGINLRAFAQRDPLNEYKAEAFNMFEAMMNRLRETIVQNLSLVEINIDEKSFASMIEAERQKEEQEKHATRNDPAMGSSPEQAENGEVVRMKVRQRFNPDDPSTWEGNVPRNAQCPCGSGKKYKYCHGKLE